MRKLIGQGRIVVNGAVEKDPSRQVVIAHDDVRMGDEKLTGPGGHRLLMMNKPAGCVTANKSDIHETVMDHMPAEHWHPNLFPIGRLDKDTTGLLLFATDGGLNQLILHPRRHVEKAYIVDLKRPMPEGAEEAFERGVELSDGSVCLPARLERIGGNRVRVILTEGRYHQVKRMIGHTGGHVTKLHRERIGPITLEPARPRGQVRPLTDDERKARVAAVRDNAKTSATPRVRGRSRRSGGPRGGASGGDPPLTPSPPNGEPPVT